MLSATIAIRAQSTAERFLMSCPGSGMYHIDSPGLFCLRHSGLDIRFVLFFGSDKAA
jgi:hypothetical protein